MNKFRPIILCGGSGTRLWPLSTVERPKHLLEIDGLTLLERTVKRIEKIFDLEPLLIIGQHELPSSLSHLEVVKEDFQNETAVAIYRGLKKVNSEYVISFHADHWIEDEEKFIEDIQEGLKLVGTENIVLFGIQPEEPNNRYGYILDGTFVEKPSLEDSKYLISQGALWNSGIFAGSRKFILNKLSEKDEVISYYEFPRKGKTGSFDVEVLQCLPREQLSVHTCMNWRWRDVGIFKDFLQITGCEKVDTNLIKDYDNVGKILVLGCSNLVIVRHQGNILIMDKDQNEKIKNVLLYIFIKNIVKDKLSKIEISKHQN